MAPADAGGTGGSGTGATGGGSATGGNAGSGGAGGRPPGACNPPADVNQPPAKLSQTGCMDAANPTRFAAFVFPYDVNSPLWSDDADKNRGLVLPPGGKIHVKDCAVPSEGCAAGASDPDDGKWVFPVGTVMVKSFSFDGKLVETRLFVRHDAATWVGYSYAWSSDQADATIVAKEGAEVAAFDTGQRTVDWHYPSRENCMTCHKPTAGSTLGPETKQMNRMMTGGINQVDALQQMGAFDGAIKPHDALPIPYPSQSGTPSAGASIERRARSYVHANCAFCHRPDDSDVHNTDLRYETSLLDTNFCGADPAKSDLGVLNAKVIDPGRPDTSTFWLRLKAPPDDSMDKHGRMPPVASFVVDTKAVDLIGQWITSLPATCPM
jgi:uncharacterized repeat protein (TIGR03806 family)